MMQRLKGKRAVVTGAAQGIGASIARRLAAEGATVALLDLDAAAAGAVLPAPHVGIACNVADTESVDRAFAQVKEMLGGVDVLVNNAGRGSAPGDGMDRYYAAQAERATNPAVHVDQTIHCEDAGWSGVLAVTLDGTFKCSRAAVRLMAEQGTGGAIVNIGSTAGVKGDGPIPYCAAKAAVLGMTRAMARELADRGIRVNAVNPGATETPIYAPLPVEVKEAIAADSLMKRLAHPDEIAGAVAFLAGDDGSFATGSIVTVNGGAWFD
ncbi:SDR family NAD(P)-dependent oxidoreductase [Sphingobium estronivorans]|uniref:SDR family NAD(P)-dependent oxidoreductase n=1 Tax=Sphingobium estronivorans TaxID=1577690 RepID=UPI0013C2FEC0|nr:SDR family oxidoreductase [Sphingobium estronivorans]